MDGIDIQEYLPGPTDETDGKYYGVVCGFVCAINVGVICGYGCTDNPYGGNK